GLDLTFDITDVPCASPSPVQGQPTPRPICSPGAGLFAFMIISTYDRGGAPSLAAWAQSNLDKKLTLEPIQWGNALEGGRLSDGRRVALTPQHVIMLDLQAGSRHPDPDAATQDPHGHWEVV